MLERDAKTLARLQAVVTALIEHRVSTSLADVEKALTKWHAGQLNTLDAHAATLRHAARCERTVERVTAAAGDRPEGILRDAVDAGLMTEAEFVDVVGKPSADVPSIDSLVDEDDASASQKKKVVEDLLSQGSILVHVDARRPEVAVPPRFRSDAALMLRFGYNLTPAISDLTVDDEGISGTLTFGGNPFRVVLPWTAIYAASVEGEQRGAVWTEDVPEDMMGGGDAPATTTTINAAPTPAPLAATPAAPDESGPRAKRATHLKLVE
ncbi:MAG TPA: ClpXP protease specificity-enhancing factor SspB [Kofleriaceae bacterium]|jgi:stringent starvation protein B